MSFNLNLGCWSSVFAVPTRIVDNDIKLASSYHLKVLLYILRNSDHAMTYESIGSALDIHPGDVKDCINFWADRGVIAIDENMISPYPAHNTENVTSPEEREEALEKEEEREKKYHQQEEYQSEYDEEENENRYGYQTSPVVKSPRPLTRPSRPDIKHVARMLSTDSELAALMEEAQMILGKTLSSGDAATLLMLRDTYGVPAEVLIMIIQYCASVDKGNMHAVEKEAINWSDEGIVTMEQADEKIKDLTERREAWNRVSRVFGFKNVGSPTRKQLEFASRWVAEWKFSDEMLREAYERCVDAKGMYDLNYINGILSNWHKSKIFNMDELRSADAARMMSDKGDKKVSDTAQNIHTKKHNYNIERTYDIGEIEKRSVLDEQD